MPTSKTKVSKTKVIAKQLTRKQALEVFPWKRGMGDVRGFSYDPKTGRAKWI